MFCIHCGTRNPDEASYCQICGKPVRATPEDDATIRSFSTGESVDAGPTQLATHEASATPAFSYQPQVDAAPYDTPSSSLYGSSANTVYGSTEAGSTTPPPFNNPYASALDPYAQQPPPAPPQKKRRGLWIVLPVAVIVIVAIWGGVTYINRSTPTRTLNTICDGLKSQDYPTVYNQFSDNFKKQVGPEASWITFEKQNFSQNGPITSCTIANVNENNVTASGDVAIAYANGHSETDTLRLVAVNGVWKMDNATKKQ